MNQPTANNPDDHETVDSSETAGHQLRARRQSRGIEIERIASQLHLKPELVEALEQDRYESLPAPVFVTGYLRNYARLLGIDPTPIIEAYRASAPSPDAQAAGLMASTTRHGGSGSILAPLIGLALIAAVIGLTLLWWQGRANSDSERASGMRPDPVEAPQPTTQTDEPDPVDQTPAISSASTGEASASVATDQSAPASADLVTEPSVPAPPLDTGAAPSATDTSTTTTSSPLPTVPDSTQSPPMPTTQPPPAGPSEPEPEPPADVPSDTDVVLAFSGPCWLDVRDANGKVVLTGEMADGDQRVLDGQPPYKFVIGNASATTLTVGGQPFDLTKRSRGNVARFSLDPADAQ